MTDSQHLLAEYARSGSDATFRELVTRYIDLVHSTAVRLVAGDAHLAEDIAQTVFSDLARLAQTLPADVMLGGWLHRHTCFVAAKTMRSERRRQSRERQAVEMNALQNDSGADFSRVAPMLDEAINELGDADRTAILLRFFEQRDFRSVGLILGSNEDAARMRVSRALEKLESSLKRRGLTTSSAALSVVLAANAVQAAPVGLAVTISTAATLAGTTIATTATATTIKTIAMTSLQKTLIGATIVAALGTGIYEARLASIYRQEGHYIREQQMSLMHQLHQATRERDDATNKLSLSQSEIGMLRQNSAELPRLRGEVARMKSTHAAAANDPTLEAADKSWTARASKLKQRLEQMPDKNIPELQFLTDKDWFDAVKNAKQLETDADFRQALNNLRNSAKNTFGDMTREALKKYAEANSGLLPGDWSQLKRFFETPVDDAILERYSLIQTGKLADVPRTEFLFVEKAPPVDDEYDSFHEFRMDGTRSSSVNGPGDIVWQGLIQFSKAHDGLLPADASQLARYLKRPLDQAKVRDILRSIPPGITTMEQLKAAGPK